MKALYSRLRIFERPFRFESNGTVDDVIQVLEKDDGDFFKNLDDRMVIEQHPDQISFHYESRYKVKSRLETTAIAQGLIRQENGGPVVIEGIADVHHSLYASVTIFALLALVQGIATQGFWGFSLLIMAGAAFMTYVYYEDRNRMIETLSEAIASTTITSERRLKTLAKKTSKKRPSDSVWNEAISEYTDPVKRRHR